MQARLEFARVEPLMGLNYNGYASLADKYLTRVEVCDSGKYSSLLQYGETIDVKKF